MSNKKDIKNIINQGIENKGYSKIFVKTTNTLTKELSILIDRINKNAVLSPDNPFETFLFQLSEGALTLGFTELASTLSNLKQEITYSDGKSGKETIIKELRAFIHQVNAMINESAEVEEDSPPTEESMLPGLRVLVAEDIHNSRLYLQRILEQKGALVTAVKNGKECFDAFYKKGPFDIIITDIFMPELSGLEVARLLREKGATVPVIALTALASRDDQRECFEAGCNDYVTKPVDPDLLTEKCRNHFRTDHPGIKKNNAVKNNVLLASGNKIVQAFLCEILKQLGATVETADNSDAAFHLFVKKKNRWDMVIIDENLESKNWLEFVNVIQSIRDNLKTLLLVERTDIERIQLAIKAGCERILPKPLDFIETVGILSELFRQIPHKKGIGNDPGEIFFLSIRDGFSQVSKNTVTDGPGTQVAVFQRSIHEKGGDRIYCRRFNRHGRCGIILADVAGHDNRSAMSAFWLTGILEGLWKYNQEPEKLLNELSQHFDSSADSDSDTRFICLLVLLYDDIRHKLHYANAGIPPGYLVDIEHPENSTQLKWNGTPVGLLPGKDSFQCGSIHFTPGNRLFLTTDGLFESISEEVTTKIFDYFTGKNLPETIEKISDYYIRSIPKSDDLTILILEPGSTDLPDGAHRFSIQSSYKDIDSVMKEIDTVLEKDFKDKIDVFLTSTAIREVLLNAVEHGNQLVSSKLVDIDIIPHEDRLEVLISDEGPGFNYNQFKKDKLHNNHNKETSIQGRGLNALEQLVMKMEFTGGSAKLVFNLS